MKKNPFLVVSVIFTLALGGCAEMFVWPFRLFQELLPIAIKYAPYALMFLESPEDEFSPEEPGQPTVALPHVLENGIQNKKKVYVLAFYLDTPEKERELERLQQQYQCRFRVRCVRTFCDLSNQAHCKEIQEILHQNKQTVFWADGPIQSLSQMKEEEKQALISGNVPVPK